MGIRFFVVVAFFALLYGALGYRFYNLQIKQGDAHAVRAASQILNIAIGPVRGNIMMTNKNGTHIPVAINKNHPFIYAVPEEIARAGINIQETSSQLEGIIGVPATKIMTRLNRPNDPFEELLRFASDEIADQVRELNIPGIYVGERPKRYYPYNSLAAHIIGFVANNKGQYGIEAYFNEKLAGSTGEVMDKSLVAPTHGQNIYLTIDQIIQAQAERVLNDTVNKFNAKGGLVIVSNPQTGAIKAMAGAPSFNPNNFSEAQMSDFMNMSVKGVYEPGSVFKLVTMAGAIDSGSVTSDTAYIDTGSLTINNRIIRNWDHRAHGRLTMRQVIEQSINTGTVFAVNQMGRNLFLNYLERFGFTRATGINLPGEVTGSIRQLINGRDINFATASYGQGISVSPIRMLTAINAIANKGIMVTPRITQGETKIEGRPISEETARIMTDIMVTSVERNVLAGIPGYSIAGKTGTAQVPDLVLGGYKDAYINTYIGFAPAHNPAFSILIRLDEPEGNPLAGASVVPAFRELAEFMLLYYNIPPDNVGS